jgi:hypothetical protein
VASPGGLRLRMDRAPLPVAAWGLCTVPHAPAGANRHFGKRDLLEAAGSYGTQFLSRLLLITGGF